jgi:hypothetical protein
MLKENPLVKMLHSLCREVNNPGDRPSEASPFASGGVHPPLAAQ